MSTFEDVETQNASRPRSERTGANGRGRWRFSAWTAGVLFGGPIELETRGNLREWMAMSEGERIAALPLVAMWRDVDGVHPTTSGYERAFREPTAPPLRHPRTALPLLGPWAPPVASGRWILYHPDGVIGSS